MPELPEVETVRSGLEPVMVGNKIKFADIRRPNLRWPFPENMSERLTGKTITRLRRRSKYILCDLDSNETLLIHLGMSGRMTILHPVLNDKYVFGDFHFIHPTPAKSLNQQTSCMSVGEGGVSWRVREVGRVGCRGG